MDIVRSEYRKIFGADGSFQRALERLAKQGLVHVSDTPPAVADNRKAVRPKASTAKNEADEKLRALLAKHHGLAAYQQGERLNCEPIGSNELERLADVGSGSATRFFQRHFKEGGRGQYLRDCRNEALLASKLEALMGEIPSFLTYGRAPQHEGGRDDDE